MGPKEFRLVTYYLEHLFFPVVFIVFAVMMADAFIHGLANDGPLDMIRFSQQTRYVFLFCFNILIAYFLFMTKRGTTVYPDRYEEVLVPIVATFWFFSYSLVEMIPYDSNPVLLAPSFLEFMIPAGIVINLIGHGLSIAGVLSLRQSFGIVTKVNEIITTGLYGVVRHPIYFGYLVMTIGFILMTPRLIHVAAYVTAVILQVWRAKIEENKLAAASADYRTYMTKVPFLVPDIRKLLGAKQ